MPEFDLRYIQAAEYKYDAETEKVSYGNKVRVGDAMSANVEIKFAEGRVYAEGRLAEYMKLATGGTISLAVSRILESAQALMYGATTSDRTVSGKPVSGLRYTAKDAAKYVGVSFYAPDMVDSSPKYTCMFVPKALFGPPSYSYTTKGQNLQFSTPTTTGEFLATDDADELLIDTATVDTIEEAKAWCDAVLAATEVG